MTGHHVPTTYVVPSMLLLPDVLAVPLSRALAPVRQQLTAGAHGEPDPRLMVWLDDLQRAADRVQQSHAASLSPTSPVAEAPVTTTADTTPDLLTTAEAAQMLGVDESTLRSLRIERRKVAGKLWWSRDDIRAELDARTFVSRHTTAPARARKGSEGTPAKADEAA